jgi:alpha-tubulin suppressor-like RCC1 family protein
MITVRRRLAILLLTVTAIASSGCDGVAGPVNQSGGAVQVVVGSEHSCALAADGAVFCWGEGRWGQIGSPAGVASSVPLRIEWNIALSQIVAGSMHTCGLTAAGGAYCWGVNTRGQIGNATTITQSSPVDVRLGRTLHVDLPPACCTRARTDAAGSIFCWGSNAQHQSGAGEAEQLLVPHQLETTLRFTAVTAGGLHTCALTEDGVAYCWGGNGLGQLGDGTTRNRSDPVPVSGDHRFRSLSAGYMHTCGVTTSQAVLCWGSSVHGELGTAGIALPGLPGAEIPQADQLDGAIRLRVGRLSRDCARLRGRSEVWCWGRGGDGQLGNGSRWDQSVPQPVMHGDLARPLQLKQVSTGVTHVCAVSESNVAFCWGRGDSGQLGAARQAAEHPWQSE